MYGPSAKSLPFTSQSGHSSLFIYCQGAGGRVHGAKRQMNVSFFFLLSLPLSIYLAKSFYNEFERRHRSIQAWNSQCTAKWKEAERKSPKIQMHH